MRQLVQYGIHVWAVVGTLRNQFLKATSLKLYQTISSFRSPGKFLKTGIFRNTSINHFFKIAPADGFYLN